MVRTDRLHTLDSRIDQVVCQILIPTPDPPTLTAEESLPDNIHLYPSFRRLYPSPFHSAALVHPPAPCLHLLKSLLRFHLGLHLVRVLDRHRIYQMVEAVGPVNIYTVYTIRTSATFYRIWTYLHNHVRLEPRVSLSFLSRVSH